MGGELLQFAPASPVAGGAELGFVFDVSAGHRVLLLFHRFHLDKVDDEMDAEDGFY